MATQENTINVSKTTILKEKGMVILPIKEYERLRAQVVPSFYLEGKEAKEMVQLVKDGEREYRAGKCKIIKSLADLD